MNDSVDISVESYTVIKADFTIVCRCCLASDNLEDIFLQNLAMNADLVELLRPNYISVSQGDGLPNFLCTGCIDSLRDWHNFQIKCTESYRFLEELARNQTEEAEEICVAPGVIIGDVKIEQLYIEEESVRLFESQEVLSNDDQDSDTNVEKFDPAQYGSIEAKDDNSRMNKLANKKRYIYSRQCPICGLVLKRGLKEHLMVHNDPTGRPFKCDHCDKTYCRKENLRQHREREHLMIRYPCDICGKVFSTKDVLSVHRKLHNSEVQYKCDECDMVFNSNKYLYKHKQKHLGVRKFICSFCGKSFMVGEYLKDHLRIHTGERPYECKLCSKNFRTMNHLRQHGRTHQSQESDGPSKKVHCRKNAKHTADDELKVEKRKEH
ncbi:zinc finger protein 184-like isoform X2 [Topomyia yanbarensis]|uniref:zinc finger protein 184-like isoform X2 n=1 Tax=Topomyia yanbarensis TaxID=2498891 RepID=UPI00273AC49A|nr:zinc finger protein 184-like isoform X2 [Topomyia yanbarensis]